jgi:hypothetical protein
MGLTLKYVQRTSSGAWRYRRRIPERLQTILDKTEFVKKLGDSEAEALRRYPAVHHAVEQVLAEAKARAALSDPSADQGPFGDDETPLSLRRRVEAHLLHEWGFDASGAGFGRDNYLAHPSDYPTDEQVHRDAAIESIYDRYRDNPEQPPVSDFDNEILELLAADESPPKTHHPPSVTLASCTSKKRYGAGVASSTTRTVSDACAKCSSQVLSVILCYRN